VPASPEVTPPPLRLGACPYRELGFYSVGRRGSSG